jgi:hypothetical protein
MEKNEKEIRERRRNIIRKLREILRNIKRSI